MLLFFPVFLLILNQSLTRYNKLLLRKTRVAIFNLQSIQGVISE